MKHIPKLLLGLVLFWYSPCHAQQSHSDFIHFPTDVHLLDNDQKQVLADLVEELEQHAHYEIAVIGHTDQDGTDAYNNELARKRALSVDDHLETLGVPPELIRSHWKGESDLMIASGSETAKRKNRRVELRYTYTDYEDLTHLIDDISSNETEQQFKIPATEQTLELKNGTTVYIPNEAFVHINGEAVTSQVDLTVIEAYSYADFVTHDLFTESKGELLESGGMIYINALADGRPLKIRENKSIELITPVQELKDGMELFNGQVSEEGVTWIPTGNLVTTTQLKNDPVEIDLSEIIDYDMQAMPRPELQFGSLPAKPRIDRKPMPPSDQIYSAKKYAEVYAKYEAKLKAHQEYLPTHKKKLESWNKEVDDRIQKIEDYRNALLEYKYHGKVYFAKKRLEKMGSRRAPLELLTGIFGFLKHPMRIHLDEREIYKKAFQNYTREIIEDRKLEVKHEGHLVYPRSTFHPELRTLVFNAHRIAKEKQFEKTGQIDNKSFGSYVAGISSLGWINYDVFRGADDLTSLEIADYSSNRKYYMIFKNMRSVLRPSKQVNKAKWKNVPVGEEVKLIAIQLINNKPSMAVMDHVTGDSEKVEFQFKSCNLVQIRHELNSLDTEFGQVKTDAYTMEVKAYPNPATTELNIEVSSPELLENLSMYDLKGNLVKSISAEGLVSTNNTISVSQYENGMYVINAAYENGARISERVLVSH